MKKIIIFLFNLIYGFISHKGNTYSLLGGINTKGSVFSIISIFTYAGQGSYSLINVVGIANHGVKTFINIFAFSNYSSHYSWINIFSWSNGGRVEVILFNIFAYGWYVYTLGFSVKYIEYDSF